MKTQENIRKLNGILASIFLRKKKLNIGAQSITSIFIVLCSASCSPILYTTVGQNVGLFHQKGETAFSANLAATDDASGGGFQFAAAIGSSTQLMTSYYGLSNGESNGKYVEFGAGKFKYSPSSKICGELIAGLGIGTISNSNNNGSSYYRVISTNYSINSNYLKPFIQPSIGISGKIIDIAFTPRIALVSYTYKSYNVSDIVLHNSLDNYFSSKANTFVFEPGVTFRAGYKNVKLQIQYNHTSFKYAADNLHPINESFISLGLHFLFSSRWLSHSK